MAIANPGAFRVGTGQRNDDDAQLVWRAFGGQGDKAQVPDLDLKADAHEISGVLGQTGTPQIIFDPELTDPAGVVHPLQTAGCAGTSGYTQRCVGRNRRRSDWVFGRALPDAIRPFAGYHLGSPRPRRFASCRAQDEIGFLQLLSKNLFVFGPVRKTDRSQCFYRQNGKSVEIGVWMFDADGLAGFQRQVSQRPNEATEVAMKAW